jgi:hypothetical protein
MWAMGKPRDERQKDLFRPPLEAIVNLNHPLVRLAEEIDWSFLDGRFGSVCRVGPGQPPLPSRLIAGLFILKHMHNLSDEVLCARWVENPYYQYFCGEQAFRHELPFDRSSMTRWRQRLGEEHLQALIQESLRVAHETGAIEAKDLERVTVDTTVQPKAVAHPTDARLMHRALEKLVKLARREGVKLRQSYVRVAKRAAIMIGRYSHAHQFKRMRRELRFLRTRLGRVIRDVRRKIAGKPELEARFRPLLDLAVKVRLQDQRQRGHKVYSLHAPEVECIGPFGKLRRQGPNALRVWLQGVDRHIGDGAEGRAVRAARQGAARQSVRRPHAGTGHRRHDPADRRRAQAYPCRQGLPRAQSPEQVPRLDLGSSPPRHQRHPARDATTSGRRAGNRPRQSRAPHGPQLPQGTQRRPRKCRARGGRIQLLAPAAMAGGDFA